MYSQKDYDVIAHAKTIVRANARKYDVTKPCFSSGNIARDYAYLHLAGKDVEEFHVLFLTSQFNLIESQKLFSGTLDQTAVFPREIARLALLHNAGAIILMHNHPSGIAEPSRQDELITTSIRETLQLFSIHCIDHIIVGDDKTYSFAEHGLL